jgi:formylglycine-generating enzyme required for sulfatase activity
MPYPWLGSRLQPCMPYCGDARGGLDSDKVDGEPAGMDPISLPARMKNRTDQEAPMPRRLPRTIALCCVAIILAQLACAQLASQPATEAPAAATSTPEIEAVVFEPPAAGQRMLWTDSSTVVYVPGGSPVMGQDETEPSDHSPAHTVTLSPFWIYQAEVTNRMYRTCVELGVCSEPTQSLWYGDPEYENAPVSGVDWNQAKAYCEWMNGRLPTEAEWELAARGTEGDPYPWGKDEPTCDLGNFLDCLVPSVPDAVRSYPLGASPYKVADMAGNVSEWVADWHGEDYYATSPASNPTGPAEGKNRVVRGSSYLTPVEDTAIYLRSSQNPLQSQPNIGFRCVVNTDAPATAPMCSLLSFDPSWDPLGAPQSPVEQGTASTRGAAYTITGTLTWRPPSTSKTTWKASLAPSR